MPLLAIGDRPLDARAIGQAATSASAGALALFVGTVRNENAGRRVLWLEYEAFEPLAIKSFERIVSEIGERWRDVRMALHHRVGRLEIGDASIVIAAAAPHRADAFAACRYAIERVKQIAPIWKREHFEGGEIWIEGTSADPEDAAARELAEERACS